MLITIEFHEIPIHAIIFNLVADKCVNHVKLPKKDKNIHLDEQNFLGTISG
jgi:hypothetical protein